MRRALLLASTSAAGVPCNTELESAPLSIKKPTERFSFAGIDVVVTNRLAGEISGIWIDEWNEIECRLERRGIPFEDFYLPSPELPK